MYLPQGFLELLPHMSDGALVASLAETVTGKQLLGINKRSLTELASRGNWLKVIELLRFTPRMARR